MFPNLHCAIEIRTGLAGLRRHGSRHHVVNMSWRTAVSTVGCGSLHSFLALLRRRNRLGHVALPISPRLRVARVTSHALHTNKPTLLFRGPGNCSVPILYGLFNAPGHITVNVKRRSISTLHRINGLLTFLGRPRPPGNFHSLFSGLPRFGRMLGVPAGQLHNTPYRRGVISNSSISLGHVPVVAY